jgi:MFS family permease
MLTCGILAAMMYPPSIALAGDLAPKDKRGSSLGGFNVFGSLGFAVGPFVGGFLAETFGYTVAFAVGGLSEVVVALITLPFLLRMHRANRAVKAARVEGARV